MSGNREAVAWKAIYSYESFEFASIFANDMTRKHETYITAIKVTEENRTGSLQIVGEWRLTSQYDPRPVAARKAQ